jgi:hypothetical protein
MKPMGDQAPAKGKDLVAETIRQLYRDLAARNRLDAMRWQPYRSFGLGRSEPTILTMLSWAGRWR